MEYKLGQGKSKYPWELLTQPGDFFEVDIYDDGISEKTLRVHAIKKQQQYGGKFKTQKQWNGKLRVIRVY